MKIKMLAAIAAVVASFAFNTSNGQIVVTNASMKTSSASSINTIVNNRIEKRFEKNFPKAEDVKWVANRLGYEARFLNDGIETAAGYNKAGLLRYYVKRYAADQLPSSVKDMVSATYIEYDILGTTEIHSDDQVIYLVNIQSKKFSKVIRITNDDVMDVYRDVALSF